MGILRTRSQRLSESKALIADARISRAGSIVRRMTLPCQAAILPLRPCPVLEEINGALVKLGARRPNIIFDEP